MPILVGRPGLNSDRISKRRMIGTKAAIMHVNDREILKLVKKLFEWFVIHRLGKLSPENCW